MDAIYKDDGYTTHLDEVNPDEVLEKECWELCEKHQISWNFRFYKGCPLCKIYKKNKVINHFFDEEKLNKCPQCDTLLIKKDGKRTKNIDYCPKCRVFWLKDILIEYLKQKAVK